MNTISNRDASVLLLLNFTDLHNGNLIGDAHVVLDGDGRVVPARNISVGDLPYYVLGATESGTATLCEIVSARCYDVHGPCGTSERLRVEVQPIADAPKVEVTS